MDDALRDAEVPPPSISKNGARKLMQRLCEEANITIDGDYLQPHGARRGLGHALYKEGDVVNAQRLLRHASIRTTHEAYSDIRAKHVAESAAGTLAQKDTDRDG